MVREAGERVRGAADSVRVRCQQLRFGGTKEGCKERDLRGMRQKLLEARQSSKTREELLQSKGRQNVLPLLRQEVREAALVDLSREIGAFDSLFKIANIIGEPRVSKILKVSFNKLSPWFFFLLAVSHFCDSLKTKYIKFIYVDRITRTIFPIFINRYHSYGLARYKED